MRRMAAALALAVSCAGRLDARDLASRKGAQMGQARGYETLSLAEAGFSCLAPTDWVRTRDALDDARTRSFGVLLSSAQRGLPFAALSLRYYAPGNSFFPDAEAYLKKQLEPGPLPLEGEKVSSPEPLRAGGKEGIGFKREAFEYLPPRSLYAEEFPVREEYAVLASKEGFFVLRYRAPAEAFARLRPVFQRALDTFQVPP